MKKLFGALVKLFSLLAVLGALLYAAVLYWDKIMGRGGQAEMACCLACSTAAVDDFRGGGLRRLGDVTASGAAYGHIILLCDHSGPFSCPAGLYLPKTDVI